MGFITYDVVLTSRSLAYICVYFLSCVLGIYFAAARVRRTHEDFVAHQVRRPNVISKYVMILACLVFFGFAISNLVRILPMLLTDFSSLRNLFWDSWDEVGVPTLLDALMAFVSGLAFFAALSFDKTRKSHKWCGFLASAVLITLCMQTLMIVGRSVIFFEAFTLIYSRSMLRNKNSEHSLLSERGKKILLSAAVVCCGLFFMVIFPVLRGAEYSSYDLFLTYRHPSEISRYVKVLDEFVPGLASVAFAADYFSTPMVKMTNLIEELETHNLYFFGAYSFSVPSKLLALISDVNYHQQARVILEALISSQGYLAIRPWTTSAHDFGMDFGLVGGVFMGGLVTYCLSKLYIYGLRIRTGEGSALCSLVALTLIIFAFKSPLDVTIIANSLFVGVFMCILSITKLSK